MLIFLLFCLFVVSNDGFKQIFESFVSARVVPARDLQQQAFERIQTAQRMPRDGVRQARAQHDELMLALAFRSAHRPAHRVIQAPQLALGAANPYRACEPPRRAPDCPDTGCRRSAFRARSRRAIRRAVRRRDRPAFAARLDRRRVRRRRRSTDRAPFRGRSPPRFPTAILAGAPRADAPGEADGPRDAAASALRTLTCGRPSALGGFRLQRFGLRGLRRLGQLPLRAAAGAGFGRGCLRAESPLLVSFAVELRLTFDHSIAMSFTLAYALGRQPRPF